jgi:hypothetical protein
MSYVFISYCRENQDTVNTLAQDIADYGHKVWLDRELAGGQAWWDQILAVIRECDVFLCALSPGSLDSPACKREYKYASSLGKPLLPVLIADGVSINLLPPELSQIQHVDYRHQTKLEAIGVLKALTGLPKSPPLPEPLPEPPPPPLSYLGGFMEQINSTNVLSFEEQAALVVKLKEQLICGEHREEVRKMLTQFKKRDDLFAKIAEEINAILAPRAREEPNINPFPDQKSAFVAPDQTKNIVAPQRKKWRFILKGLLALGGGFWLSIFSVNFLIINKILSDYNKTNIIAICVFWFVFAIVIWVFPSLVGRMFKRH